MDTLVEQFLAYQKDIRNASVNTLNAYAQDLKQFLAYLSKEQICDVQKVTETRIQAYLLYQKKNKKSTATISRSFVTIKSFLGYLVKKHLLDEDPTERIHPPKVEKAVPKYISYEQMVCLLEAPNVKTMQGRRDRAILELLYATGIKVNELIQIRLEDVNLSFGSIVVRQKEKERVLPLGQTVKVILEDYFEDIRDLGLKQEYLFVSRLNTPFTRQGIYKLVKEYGKLAGIKEEVSLQIIRNSFTVHMLENGADTTSISEILGISDVLSTQKFLKKEKTNTFSVYKKSHPRG